MTKTQDSITPLSPTDAFNLMHETPSALLVDVRSDMEFLMVGHPKGAVHVPWIDEPDWTVNPEFVATVRRKLASADAPVILICRSGDRSDDAAKALNDAGLKNLYVIEAGFEGPLDSKHQRSTVSGWRFEGLPWEQT